MLFERRFRRGIAEGVVTMTFRRWRTRHAIARSPGVRAADLAPVLGRETQPFKRDVRKLKELGLTTSLEIGYRLSPRGDAYLRASRR